MILLDNIHEYKYTLRVALLHFYTINLIVLAINIRTCMIAHASSTYSKGVHTVHILQVRLEFLL